ncbi:drug/metabolite transporter (DMT)-like permease [Desulfobaculum xiamenense]|uniref:Drug/metabolite transporter (DMT)-like permease n=1 Tax=Desulfobaculum xiamenense TaxID=995050 RepID=A0A846QWF9_9BACT|nr:DMT family transporter [Desulfobaculum xiamenense]NJB68949.1 drug/metabolite transporter (DMT)-like permease [Desulfobaculum xiamenense]
MNARILKANILLLVTAAIWGSGFVAQRSGMDYVGPMTFNAVRFAIGALSLLPLLIWHDRKGIPAVSPGVKPNFIFLGALAAGTALFCAVSLQQIGMIHTPAAKAGFITGLYVVIVPFLGLALGQRPGVGGFIGTAAAAVGLYLVSVTKDFTIAPGDTYVIIGAVLWAGHMQVLGWLSPKLDGVRLAFGQFAVCSVLCTASALAFEDVTLAGIAAGWIPIVYGGIMPVGVAFTLQIIAQKDAPPTHAAIILSLEAVFAAFGGWLILGETLTTRAMFGCALMLAGMLAAQLWPERQPATAAARS